MKTIIEMAGKAFETPGVEPAFRNGFWTVTSEELERFAELIRADERERPWVGLTGQEKAWIASVSLDTHDAVYRTDVKLKEKNT